MLKAISLHTIKEIFETEATKPLSSMARMTYMSCLMYYFEDMPLDLESNKSFDIILAQVKSYPTSKKYFQELQASGLVLINPETITFLNVWNRHIDKSILARPSPEVFLGLHQAKPPVEYQEELIASKSIKDLGGMKYKLQDEQINALIREFIKEKTAAEQNYLSYSEIAKHFLNWLNKRGQNMPKTANNDTLGKKLFW